MERTAQVALLHMCMFPSMPSAIRNVALLYPTSLAGNVFQNVDLGLSCLMILLLVKGVIPFVKSARSWLPTVLNVLDCFGITTIALAHVQAIIMLTLIICANFAPIIQLPAPFLPLPTPSPLKSSTINSTVLLLLAAKLY